MYHKINDKTSNTFSSDGKKGIFSDLKLYDKAYQYYTIACDEISFEKPITFKYHYGN